MTDEPGSYDVLGVPVTVTSLPDATDCILRWKEDGIGRFVCIRDVHGVMRAVDEPRLMDLHGEAAMVTPDGMPLVALGRWRGLPVQRTCGPDLIAHLAEAGQSSGLRHYLYGGAPGVAERLASEFRKRFTDIQIVGVECPPFRPPTDREAEETRARISDSGADVVWVGLSTPKQEFWMQSNYRHLSATLIGVGAAFDFHTGRVKRAPVWMQRTGLEWLHRLVSEPRRLWRRYLILAPRFVLAVGRDRFVHRFARRARS